MTSSCWHRTSPSGRMVLVDGQHRLRAAVIAGETRKWIVRVVWTQSAEEIHGNLDRLVRPRTRGDAAHSIGYEDLDPKTKNIMIGAAQYLLIWDPEYELPELCHRPPERDCIARSDSRIDAVKKSEEILNLERATREIKNRMSSSKLLAVIIETLHAAPEESEAFWTAVMTNGEGIAGELRAALLTGRPPRSSVNYLSRLMVLGWNQRHSNSTLRRETRRTLKMDVTGLIMKP